MAHMHTVQFLQHRGHFAFMNYFVVSGTTGKVGFSSNKEWREGGFFPFLCTIGSSEMGRERSPLESAGLQIKQASSADKKGRKNTVREGIQESKERAHRHHSN